MDLKEQPGLGLHPEKNRRLIRQNDVIKRLGGGQVSAETTREHAK